MFFNYDLFEIVAVAFVVSGILTFSIYKSSPINNNESLVNTNSMPSELSTNLIDAGVQTDANIQVEASVQAANTYVNTGVQTSSRMWLESIRNWTTEILGTPSNPAIVEGYVDVGVQTNGPSLWTTFKQFFLEVCSVRSSELSSIGIGKVTKWRNTLDSDQTVDLHNSDSPLTTLKFGSDSELQNLVDPNDSASNVSEVVSNSSIRFYSMSNKQDVLDLMNDPTVAFGINGAYDPADDMITFITPDASYDILRSSLEALLNSVN